MTRLAVIKHHGEPVGMLAVQEIKLGPVHIVDLNRGPLWFMENPGEELLKEFAKTFDAEFPRRCLRRRRWLPEWEYSESAEKILQECGFQPKSSQYKTCRLDLTSSIDALKAGMKKSWRNALSKAERAGIRVEYDTQGIHLELFLQCYFKHKLKKKYLVQSPGFIREEVKAALPFDEALMLWAHEEGEVAAGILVLLHGNSASYRVGWITERGRQVNAHNLLLWKAIEFLKDRHIQYLDLGGIDPEKGVGITQFKQGLGGEEVQLLNVHS